MLHFGMNMPFILMMLYGSMMIVLVLLFRIPLKKKLPKFVFPLLWCVVLVRLLVPFSLSSPLSIKVSEDSFLSNVTEAVNAFTEDIAGATTVYSEAVTEAIPALPADIATEADVPDSLVIESFAAETASVTTAIEDFRYDTPPSATAGTATIILEYDERDGFLSDVRDIPVWGIYFLGLLLTSGILLFQKYRYTLKLRNRFLIEHNETINTLLREMDMGHILVFSNDEIASPLTCGLLRPCIYLPTRMDFSNRELLRHILMHETMHIKHRDNWVKTFMLVALCLNWFNLLVWLMVKCLASDLETACDEAVLKHCQDEEERKNYAFSLLSMAITGNRTTLLYSAFSKTEVEKRIQSILHYKKASVFLLTAAILFMTCSTVAFATGVQAPFSPYLTSTCASDGSRWGAKVYTTRNLTLGKDAQKRAEDIVFNVLRADTDSDPIRMDEEMRTALSEEFHVEKNAFRTDFFLCLSDETLEEEYASWDLARDESGFYLYKGEPVRLFVDDKIGRYYSQSTGTFDITIIRDRFGYITDVRVQRTADD